jgi:hypothetical protein
MPFLRGSDIISGQQGKATMKIDNRLQDAFFIKQFEATMEKTKSEVRTLGHSGNQHKATGWNGTGTMTIYYVTSLFRRMALDYVKTGKDAYFDITVENNDPTSGIGRQTVVFYNCNIDSTVIAKLDVDNTELDEDVSFTYEDFDILDEFGQPILGG